MPVGIADAPAAIASAVCSVEGGTWMGMSLHLFDCCDRLIYDL